MFKLSINDLRLWVHLGCGEEEKFNLQMVSITVDIYFKSIPAAAQSDDISDTVCYLQIVNAIKNYCYHKRFSLIEYLSQSVFDQVKIILEVVEENIDSVSIEIHKVAPPVPDVHGGIKWTQQT